MKKIILLAIISLSMSSCLQYSLCPVYSSAKPIQPTKGYNPIKPIGLSEMLGKKNPHKKTVISPF